MQLLTLLSEGDYERLRPNLTNVKLTYKKPLYEASIPVEHIYFPIDGVASLVSIMANGSAVEVGTIGSEGMVGLPVVLGDQYAPSIVYVQVPGTALQIDTRKFREALEESPTLKFVLLRYVHAFFNQVSQSAACAHLHSLEQRCCRWLLMNSGPDAFRPVSAYARIPWNDAWCPKTERVAGDECTAKGRHSRLPAWPRHDTRSQGSSSLHMRML